MKKIFSLAILMTFSQAFAQSYELVGTGEATVKILPKTRFVKVKVALPVYSVDQYVVAEDAVCKVPSCTSGGGDGSKGDWKGFFEAKTKSKKAAALDAAIKGIGEKTAKRIVDGNLFSGLPGSWELFSLYIKEIEEELNKSGYSYKFATNVLEVHGYDNMVNLGYLDNKTTCTFIKKPCTVYSLKESKKYIYDTYRSIDVRVKNQVLQPFESDTVVISVGQDSRNIKVSAKAPNFNSYEQSVSFYGDVITLDATRKMNAFPSDEVVSKLSKGENGKLKLAVNFPVKYLNPQDKGAEFSATYEVCRSSWFGTCYEVVGGPWTTKLKKNSFGVSFTTNNLTTGSKYFVRTTITKNNSQYYSDESSSPVLSNSVQK